MGKPFDIWNESSPLAEEAYRRDNCRIEDHPGGSGTCVIYCSSNNIWFPNEEAVFRRRILEDDAYEWTRIRVPGASREIFLRDIYKSWYVTGINDRLDTLDKLIAFLRQQCRGYSTVVIGSSAGGYLAALLSAKLEAAYAIVFSAQFEVRNPWAMEANPFLQRYRQEEERSRYYDLKDHLADSKTPVYYILPGKSPQDLHQLEHIRQIPCVKPIVLRSRRHGVVVLKGNLKDLLSLSREQMEELHRRGRGKALSPIGFSLELAGVKKTLAALGREALAQVKKRLPAARKGARE